MTANDVVTTDDCPRAMTECVASELVDAGAALLDEEVTDWLQRVNPDTLDVRWSEDCPLGQLFGGFDAGCSALRISAKHAWLFGFNAPYPHMSADYVTLTAAWCALIDARLSAMSV